MADSPLRRAHQEWIGNVRPEGLLVSLPALELAQAAVDRNPTTIHRALLELLPRDRQNEPIPELPGFSQFAERVLGWPMDLYGAPPENLHTFLETYREALRPTAALLDLDGNVLLAVSEVPKGTDFDSPPKHETRGWNASPYAWLERLLRETGHSGRESRSVRGAGSRVADYRAQDHDCLESGPLSCERQESAHPISGAGAQRW